MPTYRHSTKAYVATLSKRFRISKNDSRASAFHVARARMGVSRARIRGVSRAWEFPGRRTDEGRPFLQQ